MNSFEFNKIAGAVLAAALFLMVIGKVSDALVHPHMPAKPHIAVTDAAPAAATPGSGPATAPPLPPDGNAEAGKVVYARQCTTCHTAEKGGQNKVGPNQFGIVGRKPGTVDGFAYSACILAKTGPWTDEALNSFLWKPSVDCKGTKMAFAGLKDKERADVIAYLKTLK